jgi:DnaJ family protein C protein 28
MSIITSVLPQTRCLPLHHVPYITTLPRRHKHNASASAKLFEDARREEQVEKREIERRKQATDALLIRQADRNWDGDEPIADTVLRMLVDKYKPLRSGAIITADEKLSKAAPSIRVGDTPSDFLSSPPELTLEEAPVTSMRLLAYPEIDRSKPLKEQSLLPAVEGHRPWHTSFTAPSHATASIRLGNIEPAKSGPSPSLDEKARKLEKDHRKRFQTAFKLEGAKESVMEHRLGDRQQKRAHANPATMKGWRTLVEERIQVFRTCVSVSRGFSFYSC